MGSKLTLRNNLDNEFTIEHQDGLQNKLIKSNDIAVAVDTIDDFPSVANTGDVAIVRDMNRGGTFIYDATKSAENNGGTVFDGWVRQYSGAVDVKWFGAKGDGVTDDTVAIQNALNNALHITMDGEHIIESTLYISAHSQAITGGTLKPRGTGGKFSAIEANNKNFITISGVTIDYSLVIKAGSGIKFVSCNNCTIDNNSFLNAPNTDNVYFIYGGADIEFTELSSYNKVTNNKCISGQVYGINFTTSSVGDAYRNLIAHNIVKDCTAYGIVLYRAEGATISANFSDFIISENYVENISGSVNINDSSQDKWFGAGIYIQMAKGCKVINNYVKNTCYAWNIGSLPIAGICGTTTDCYVSGNVVEDSAREGYFFSAGNIEAIYPSLETDIMQVFGNKALNTTRAGYRIYNAYNLEFGDNFSDGNLSGLICETRGDFRTDVSIDSSSFKNVSSGIVVDYGKNVSITDIKISDTSSTGITVKNIDFLKIKNSSLSNIALAAISLANTVTDGYIDGVNFSNVTGFCGVMSGNMQIGECSFLDSTSRWSGAFGGDFRTLENIGTPSVKNHSKFQTGGTTTITAFTGMEIGQIFTIRADHNVQISYNSSLIVTKGATNVSLASTNIITFQATSSVRCIEVSRNF